MRLCDMPIIMGCYDKADKALVIVKDEKYGGYSLLTCRLEKMVDFGDTNIPKENFGKVISHFRFCKIESARAFAKAANKIVELWEGELKNK